MICANSSIDAVASAALVAPVFWDEILEIVGMRARIAVRDDVVCPVNNGNLADRVTDARVGFICMVLFAWRVVVICRVVLGALRCATRDCVFDAER